MRWPFRRKADSAEQAGGSAVGSAPESAGASAGGQAAAGSGAASGGAAAVRPPARQWATLPAIPVTTTRDAPLVAGPAPVLPPLLSGRRGGSAPRIEPALGSVTGLAKPVTRAAEPVASQESAAPVLSAPVVHRPARPMPAEVPSLVDAVDEYVGEPREPAEPHRAPGFLRYTPDWLTPSTPSIPGLPELPILPGQPAPVPQAAQSLPFFPPEQPEPQAPAPLPELPPRMTEVPTAEQDGTPRPARKRRANLGQSRKLGLGAPVSRADGEPLIHPEEPPRVVEGAVETAPQPPHAPAPPDAPEPPQEPPPPPAAPPHVAVEQPAADDGQDEQGEDRPDRDDEPRPPTPPPAPPMPPAPPADGPKRAVATVYRATPELRPVPRRRELPRATVVNTVPPNLANELRARQQADVASVPVYRGPKVTAAARSRGARAFAAGGAVFLPDDAGPVDAPQTRGLLAHELVHAVQQRTLGGHLPSPDSPHGQALEAEAQVAERYYSGSAGAEAPAPLIHAPLPAAAPAPEPEPDLSMAAQLATALGIPPPQTTVPTQQTQTLQSPFDPATRAEVGKIAEDSAKHVVAEWQNPALHAKDGKAPAGAKAAAAGNTPGAGAQNAAVAAAVVGPAFNRDARRNALVEQRLAGLNQNRYGDQLTNLDDAQLLEIENQLDAEEGAAGGTVAQTAPTGPVYEKNSKEAWMHALTGTNVEYGLGLTGFKEEVGSEKSWWGAKTDDKRPMERKLLDGFGLSSKEAENQFDTDTWWADDPAKDKAADGKSDAESDAQPAHDDWKYGQPNPDKGAFDVNRIDLDELAGRLYDRVRSRLRLELLVDRERAGLLTDFR